MRTGPPSRRVDDSHGGIEDITGLTAQGRYLRMQGVKRAGQYGYSIFEIQAFSGTPVLPPVTPPVTEPPPVTIDPGQPGVAISPVAATSSPVENNGMSAAMAIDGKTGTRWASKFEDGAWIQFDFGAKTPVGYMKLLWENAYGKQYALQVSDDGQNWSQVRYVSNGHGGTEEFFNLGINARYIRLQGVARATQYGYSLLEVRFKTPGSDNSLPSTATSALKFPANGAGWTPLPAAAQPLESLQFTLADGTLVTRFGARGLARHGRERGEEWNEIGYGPNETVDPVTGLPQDKGPGNYLTFVPQYFKNRTWGVEIIDNSRVRGVTKPTLIVNQYTTVDFLSGGVAFFRGFDRPGVTGYGWMSPGELVDRNVPVCKPMAYPANDRLTNANGINGACTLLIKEYPGHGGLDANGMPNGTDVKARALTAGDIIEVSPSMFSTTASMASKGDDGGIRYYSYEWTYVVGAGLRPWYGVQPRLNGVPLPEETLSGGLGSVSYNYSDNALFMFQQPHTNIGMQNMQRFVEGRRLVHTNFTTGDHNEGGNDRYAPAVGLQGQRYGQSACIACHVNNGRSPAPAALNQRLDTMAVRVASLNAAGQQVPHPQYGTAIQMNAVSPSGVPQNWGNSVSVGGFTTRKTTLADGTQVELRKPTLAFEGPVPQVVSLRAAPPMIGTGLLEAVDRQVQLARQHRRGLRLHHRAAHAGPHHGRVQLHRHLEQPLGFPALRRQHPVRRRRLGALAAAQVVLVGRQLGRLGLAARRLDRQLSLVRKELSQLGPQRRLLGDDFGHDVPRASPHRVRVRQLLGSIDERLCQRVPAGGGGPLRPQHVGQRLQPPLPRHLGPRPTLGAPGQVEVLQLRQRRGLRQGLLQRGREHLLLRQALPNRAAPALSRVHHLGVIRDALNRLVVQRPRRFLPVAGDEGHRGPALQQLEHRRHARQGERQLAGHQAGQIGEGHGHARDRRARRGGGHQSVRRPLTVPALGTPEGLAYESRVLSGLLTAALGAYAAAALLAALKVRHARAAVGLGLGLHLSWLVWRGVAIGFFPLTNKAESFSAASFALALVVFVAWQPVRTFVLPQLLMALAAGVAAANFPQALGEPGPLLRTLWYPAHVPLVLRGPRGVAGQRVVGPHLGGHEGSRVAPAHRSLRAAGLWAVERGDDLRRHLGRGGLGRLLHVGPQDDLVDHPLVPLRVLHPRAADALAAVPPLGAPGAGWAGHRVDPGGLRRHLVLLRQEQPCLLTPPLRRPPPPPAASPGCALKAWGSSAGSSRCCCWPSARWCWCARATATAPASSSMTCGASSRPGRGRTGGSTRCWPWWPSTRSTPPCAPGTRCSPSGAGAPATLRPTRRPSSTCHS